ncbi:MAG: YihY/virulence factor BrkB family protein [Gammaproteobacteria bacterium]
MSQVLQFALTVLRSFRSNQGFLLAGAVAYYTLLSMLPMLAVILVVLSQVVEPAQLLETIKEYLTRLTPGQAAAITEQLELFLASWKLMGLIGIVVLIFFSSLAFTVLENAMSVIFFHRVAIRRRHFLVSAILPYCYILLLALGLFVVSVVSGNLHSLDERPLTLLHRTWEVGGYHAVGIYILGVAGEVLLLTSLYLAMPVGRLAWRNALIGGVTATLLWEATRHALIWYYSKVSFVSLVYGSFAAAVVILISLEAAAIIILLGAQVIAEYERRGSSDARVAAQDPPPTEPDQRANQSPIRLRRPSSRE